MDARMQFADRLFSYDTACAMHRQLTNVCLSLTIRFMRHTSEQGYVPTREELDGINLLFDLVDWIGVVAEEEANECRRLRQA